MNERPRWALPLSFRQRGIRIPLQPLEQDRRGPVTVILLGHFLVGFVIGHPLGDAFDGIWPVDAVGHAAAVALDVALRMGLLLITDRWHALTVAGYSSGLGLGALAVIGTGGVLLAVPRPWLWTNAWKIYALAPGALIIAGFSTIGVLGLAAPQGLPPMTPAETPLPTAGPTPPASEAPVTSPAPTLPAMPRTPMPASFPTAAPTSTPLPIPTPNPVPTATHARTPTITLTPTPTPNGVVKGKLYWNGIPLPQVKVHFHSYASHHTWSATLLDGSYELVDLPAGNGVLTVEGDAYCDGRCNSQYFAEVAIAVRPSESVTKDIHAIAVGSNYFYCSFSSPYGTVSLGYYHSDSGYSRSRSYSGTRQRVIVYRTERLESTNIQSVILDVPLGNARHELQLRTQADKGYFCDVVGYNSAGEIISLEGEIESRTYRGGYDYSEIRTRLSNLDSVLSALHRIREWTK